MENFNLEEFAQRLIRMAKEFDPHDYKANALKELEEVESSGKSVPHIAFIINEYPDFNHIELKCTQPGEFTFKICVKPELILENNNQLAYELAGMYAFWASRGGHEE